MGKVATATATTVMKRKRKKKGRPSLLDLQKRNLIQQQSLPTRKHNPNNNFSTRRNPNPDVSSSDEDDKRKEKKVKLIVRLPQSEQHFPQNPRISSRSLSMDSGSGSDSNADSCDDHEASVKNRKIDVDGDRSNGVVADHQGEKVSTATNTLHGSPLVSGPTIPLPDKKLLVFILDRLQKKDTYGVFSEPVDQDELPNYHEIIEHPMDFGTVRKKFDGGIYTNLDELEADLFLICTNAMQYNAADTVYFRQARSIQELAKRDFENLRQEGNDGEPEPKVVRRGRPPGKNQKKPPSKFPADRVVPDLSPAAAATLASSTSTLGIGDDNAVGSNSYNLRRGSMLSRFRSAGWFVNSHCSRNGENYSEWLSDNWNDEFPASILKAEMKYGKKQFSTIDENRRDTYEQFLPSDFCHASQLFNLDEDAKQLMAVGLHVEHCYARSLAQFAANLGPVVWKIALKKIASALPTGMKFGPGWVGENEGSPLQLSFSSEKLKSSSNFDASRLGATSDSGVNSVVTCRSVPCRKETFEPDTSDTTQNESALLINGVSERRPGSIQTQQKPLIHTEKTSLNGLTGCNFSSQIGMRPAMSMGQSGEGVQMTSQRPFVVSRSEASTFPATKSHIDREQSRFWRSSGPLPSGGLLVPGTAGVISHNRQYSFPVPPDLNVRYQGPGSPSSSLRTGSPQHPDLAVQL